MASAIALRRAGSHARVNEVMIGCWRRCQYGARREFSDAASGEKRLHSTDIAFKPTEGGWGFNNRFASGYDRIFSKQSTSATEQGNSLLSKQLKALDDALSCGALTRAQYDDAVQGARTRAG